MPEPPPRPASPQKNQRGSWLSIFLMALLAVGVGSALFVVSLGQLLPVLVIGAVIFLVTAFHYVIWGWWLGKMIEREAQDEERDQE